MNYYFNIKINSDAEFNEILLMNILCSKLHKILFDIKSKTIGISFPNCDKYLGSVLRIHGSDVDLLRLQDTSWLGGFIGYCKLSEIKVVPQNVRYRVISRQQPMLSQSKLKRLIKRGSISEEDVKSYYIKMEKFRLVGKPWLEFVSNTNGQRYRRYVLFGDLKNEPSKGDFDQFGFSKTATIPWF